MEGKLSSCGSCKGPYRLGDGQRWSVGRDQNQAKDEASVPVSRERGMSEWVGKRH